jgi:phosphatidylserine/phosphatidylglycerophosphate/cardiolipin synthase-like enzyme
VKPVVRAIDRANRTVFFEAYILTQREIVRALERAAAQGVAVYALLDPHPYGMGDQPGQMASGLRAAGVAVRWSSSRYYFTHAKYLVVDDRLAVVSTANFSQAAFTSNREFLVFDHDRADVHDLSNLFRSDWDHLPFGSHNRDLVLSPGSRPVLASFLQGARRSVEVYAEEVADPALDRLLIRLHRRLRVEVMVASSYRSPGLTELLRAGVAVRGLRFPYIHAKMFLEDGHVAFVGSENLSPTSLELNREVGIFVQGRSVSRVAATFSRDWSKAVIRHSANGG